jgi:membrane protein implicated in regulation of membrane protease activity
VRSVKVAAAWLGAGIAMQYVVAAVIGICATYVFRRSKYGKASKSNVLGDPNVNMDIGQSITVDIWKIGDDEKSRARVMYRGAMWDVELVKDSIPKAGFFVIREVRGSCLIVSNERRNNV